MAVKEEEIDPDISIINDPNELCGPSVELVFTRNDEELEDSAEMLFERIQRHLEMHLDGKIGRRGASQLAICFKMLSSTLTFVICISLRQAPASAPASFRYPSITVFIH